MQDSLNSNIYICNYPHDQNVCNILTTNRIEKIYPDGYEQDDLEHIFSYSLYNTGDLLKSLNIISWGGKIKEIIITVKGNTIYNKKNINDDSIQIQPFIFGIPMASLPRSCIKIFIITDYNNCELFIDYLLLNTKEEQYISQKKLEFDNGVTIENSSWSQETFLEQRFIDNILTDEYKCNYPCKVDDIIAPEIIQRCITSCHDNKVYSYHINQNRGDIIKNIIIKKEDDCEYKYTISIGPYIFYESPCYNDKGRTFTPCEYGIPQYALERYQITIKIHSKSKIKLFIKSLLIKDEDKENKDFIIPVKQINIKNGYLVD